MSGVTPNGIRYPDGASKAKNLGPELQQMAEDIDEFLDAKIDSTNPLFVDLAEQAVDDALDTAIIPAIDSALPPAIASYVADSDLLHWTELGAVRTLDVDDELYSEVRLSFDFRRIGGTLRGGGEVGILPGSAESALAAGNGVVLLTRDYRRARVDTANGWPVDSEPVSADFTALAQWGDSMTTNQGNIGVSVAEELAREMGVAGYDLGVSGDTPTQIAWRFGGIPVTVDLGASRGTLPASGQIPVTVEPALGWSALARAWPCIVHDVNGQPITVTLRQAAATPSTVPTWTLEQTGASSTTRYIYSNTRIAHTQTLDRSLQQAPAIVWMGRNDFDLARGEYAIRGILGAARNTGQRILVRPVFNGPDASVTAYNAMLLEHAGPARWLDSKRLLIEHGLEIAGITPTADDLTAIAEGRIPPSLVRDGVHLTGPGRIAQARAEAIDIKARNW